MLEGKGNLCCWLHQEKGNLFTNFWFLNLKLLRIWSEVTQCLPYFAAYSYSSEGPQLLFGTNVHLKLDRHTCSNCIYKMKRNIIGHLQDIISAWLQGLEDTNKKND